jgi:YHS domain-containing protein
MKKRNVFTIMLCMMGFLAYSQTVDHAQMKASMQKKPAKQSEPLKEDGIDPVCKMKVAKGTTLTSTHKGKQVGFCSEYCKEHFDAKPEKYTEQH